MSLLKLIIVHWFLYASVKWLTGPEIEKLVVSIEGDFSDLISQADQGVEQTKDKLGELDSAGQKAGKGLKGSAAIAGAAFGGAAAAAQALLAIVKQLAVATFQFFSNLSKQAIAINTQFETLGIQFETLLGSAEAAGERLAAIRKFAIETPFELPEIVSANRNLQLFGGTALATNDNMRLLGDAVAGVSGNIQEISIWFGRLYSQIQGGKPFGEAAARLQELGILSNEVRTQMEAMQKEGKTGAEIWAFFAEQIGSNFAGNMERLAKTLPGIQSNISDFTGEIIRLGGKPYFEEVRASAQQFLDLLNENEGVITKIATGFGTLAASALRFVRERIFGDLADNLIKTTRAGLAFTKIAGGFISSFFSPILKTGGLVLKFFDDLLLSIPLLGHAVEFLRGMWTKLDEALIAGAQIFAFAKAGADGLAATLRPLGELVKTVGEAILAFISGDFATASAKADEAMAIMRDGLIDLDAGSQAAKESLLESARAIDELVNAAESADDAGVPDDVPDFGGAVENMENAKAMLGDLALELADLQEETNAKLAELQADHQERMAKIETDGAEKRLEINKRFDDGLAKLAAETEDKRLKIIAKAQEDLAKLRDDTDKKLAESSADFDEDELRRTEDHLREMRRLEDQFLLDLQDAVRERDARAIVDLERRFAMESQEREEDFETESGRREDDQSQELAAIRKHESERRNEILASQSQELEELRLAEETKRLEIEARRRDDLEKLDASLVEKRNKEIANYQERQANLEQALQKQLEAITKNLADENEVTEEGARKILETLMEYFGIGGEIDQLMEQFATRRRLRADIEVKFESSPDAPAPVLGGGGPLSGLVPIPAFQHGGQMVATKPTLAMFGEAGPEIATFTPLSELSQVTRNESSRDFNFNISLDGAPPGMDQRQMEDALSGVILRALRDSGALNEA